MVKIFPVKFFGPDYIKELKGPLNDIEMMACGGITVDNISRYFSSGADAVAFGSSIFRKEWINDGLFQNIEDNIRSLLEKL